MEVEIRVDRGLCIGSGQCVHVAPRTFDQDDGAIAYVIDPRGDDDERVVRAITACPMHAISLRVGEIEVGAAHLQDWTRGVRSDDPLVATLGHLSEAHHELSEVLDGSQPGHEGEISALVKAHLLDEDGAYAAMTALVDPALVDAFEADHERIVQSLAELDGIVDGGGNDTDRRRAAEELTVAVRNHIRIEEAVLFPLALAALGRQWLTATSG